VQRTAEVRVRAASDRGARSYERT